MASEAISDALGRTVRFREMPMQAVRRGNPDMAAMWDFLRGTGYQADIAALRRSYPAVEWSSFTIWAHRGFGPVGFLGRTPQADGCLPSVRQLCSRGYPEIGGQVVQG